MNNLCVNPDCGHFNPADAQVCLNCGSPLGLVRRYRVEQVLGAGGFAQTFLAIDELCLQKPCVIKQFLPPHHSPDIYQKAEGLFKQEATILATLGKHPQIPSLFAFFEEGERLYIVQEYFEGQDIFKELTQKGTFSEGQILKLLQDLLPVLQYVHEHQVIHRDIKPSNMIRQPNDLIALIDFGSSLRLDHRLRSNSGTPGYAAPEQMQGRVCAASDLYSLGITCLRLLTGLLPSNDGSDPLFKHSKDNWNWHQTGLNVGPVLSHILDKLLQTDTENRFQTASEVLQILRNPDLETIVSLKQKHLSIQSRVTHLNTQLSIYTSSKVGIDLRKLQSLLSTQQFKEADHETWKLLLEITNRTEKGRLNVSSLQQCPVRAVRSIDQLWSLLSNGHFGFSVQKRIYEKFGGSIIFDLQPWQSLGEQVGWKNGEDWRAYSQLTFGLEAPLGHLPACFVSVENRRSNPTSSLGDWWRLGFATLMHRLNDNDHSYSRFPTQKLKAELAPRFTKPISSLS